MLIRLLTNRFSCVIESVQVSQVLKWLIIYAIACSCLRSGTEVFTNSMMRLSVTLIFLMCMPLLYQGSPEHDRLYSTITTGYNKKTFPTLNLTTTVNIAVDVRISSLNTFEELSGQLSVSFLFIFLWKEERISWNESDYGGMGSLLMDPSDVWLPQVNILQPSDRIKPIGDGSTLLRVTSNGIIEWFPAEVLNLACSVDVTYFPFDTQRCQITIAGLIYDPHEVLMFATETYMQSYYYTDNSQWELMQSPFASGNLGDDPRGPSCVNVTLVLRRRSEFFIVYIIVPITFLGLINDLVFLIPASSGERSSVAITTFLSFVVYMGILDDIVPKSSSPIAYIYYYILFLMLYSSTILFLCILSQIIHENEGVVSGCVRCLFCKCFSVRKDAVTSDNDIFEVTQVEGDSVSRKGQLTWKHVGNTFDKCCFVLILIGFLGVSAISFYIVYSAATTEQAINRNKSLF